MTISMAEYNEILTESRRFAKQEIQPAALEMETAPDTAWLTGIWHKSRQLDLPALLLPASCDGAAFTEMGAALILDTLAAHCAGVASVFAHHFAACVGMSHANAKATLPEACRQILAPKDNAVPLLAPVIPSESGQPSLSLVLREGEIEISGTTELTANADYAEVFLIFGRDPQNAGNLSCAIVPAKSPGLSRGKNPHLPGLKVNPLRRLTFDQVRLPESLLIGPFGQTAPLLAAVSRAGFGFVAALATGCARTALQKARAYAEKRYQFGDLIINHPEIQRMLGMMRQKLEVATAVLLQTFTPEHPHLAEFSADSRLTKAYCTEAALAVVQDAIQIHGGYGYMHEYGLEKIMRDAKVLQLLGGRNPAHHIAVISENRE